MEQFVLILAPFAPHLAEELWQKLGHTKTLSYEPWPDFDSAKIIDETVEVVFQVNGKVRSRLQVQMDTSEKDLEELALKDENVQRHVDGKRIGRKIIVRNKLVNIVLTN